FPVIPSFFILFSPNHPYLHSFPTRRSSDLLGLRFSQRAMMPAYRSAPHPTPLSKKPNFSVGKRRVTPPMNKALQTASPAAAKWPDRKSTRLNSSHVSISYAVFCLKKKTNKD